MVQKWAFFPPSIRLCFQDFEIRFPRAPKCFPTHLVTFRPVWKTSSFFEFSSESDLRNISQRAPVRSPIPNLFPNGRGLPRGPGSQELEAGLVKAQTPSSRLERCDDRFRAAQLACWTALILAVKKARLNFWLKFPFLYSLRLAGGGHITIFCREVDLGEWDIRPGST